MPDVIQEVFLDPPLALARLGGSTVPQDAYKWVQATDPRSSGQTVIEPDWSLTVEADGTVTPIKPEVVRLRDGALIRPVAPFLEVWARVGAPGSNPQTWREARVTPTLLAAEGLTVADVRFKVTAINSKAARRMGNPALRFGTFPPVEVRGNDHRSVALLATSPPGVTRRMIPTAKRIPLGSVQVIRSRAQPTAGATPWESEVDVEVLRLRFTPARGHMYGPPASATPQPTPRGDTATPVDSARAFLNPQAGWTNVDVPAPDQPADTFDGASVSTGVSLGVVDDTCEARIELSFALPQQQGRTVSAASTVFVSPPDFAPDRRPFLSLADELNDRTADGEARNAALSVAERDTWVEDLFERIQETVSLFNIDYWRTRRSAQLSGQQLTDLIPGDLTPGPNFAMGGRDRLRSRMFSLSAPAAPNLLPLTDHARMRHRALADLQSLRDFVLQNPGRLKALIRPPFARLAGDEAVRTTMAMPPFMRNSNADPLTLARWQYDLLMAWIDDVEQGLAPVVPGAAIAAAAVAPDGEPAPLSAAAQQHRDSVLRRLDAAAGPQQ